MAHGKSMNSVGWKVALAVLGVCGSLVGYIWLSSMKRLESLDINLVGVITQNAVITERLSRLDDWNRAQITDIKSDVKSLQVDVRELQRKAGP